MSGPFSNTPSWLNEHVRDLMDNSTKRTKAPAHAEWVGPGQTTTVNGHEIPDAMLYVGDRLTSVEQWFGGTEPALVNPRLRVGEATAQARRNTLGYRIAFANMSPESRAVYLEWLASGRRQPDVNIDYVRLFFFGLERRVIHDIHQDQDRPSNTAVGKELNAIGKEVKALVSTYRHDQDFTTRATEFLAVLDTIAGRYLSPVGPPPWATSKWDVPEYVRFALGCFVYNNDPISASWALRWLQTSASAKFRTPSKRCPTEFSELWNIRFDEQFPDGFAVKPGRRKLDLDYRPDTWTMLGVFEFPTDLHDVAEQSAPLRDLQALANRCEDELDPYSRYVGKNTAIASSLAARALLPAVLINPDDRAIEKLRTTLEKAIGNDEIAVIKSQQLIKVWSPQSNQLGKADSASLANVVAALGFGMEPDVSFGGKPLSSGPMVIFRTNAMGAQPSAAYEDALLIIDLAVFVLAANGKLSPAERARVLSIVDDAAGLGEQERARVNAHVEWLLASKPSLTGMKPRLRAVSATGPELGNLLLDLTITGSHAPPSTISGLTKVFRLLELEEQGLYQAVHDVHTGQAGAALKSIGGTAADTPSSPSESGPKKSFGIDMARVHKTMAESAEVSQLLGSIFSEDQGGGSEGDEGGVAPAGSGSDPFVAADEASLRDLVEGLDGPHSALLRELAAREFWTGDEVSQLSARLNLLPGGAIDTLNEVAFDRVGDPVCEGDSDITVDLQVASELLN